MFQGSENVAPLQHVGFVQKVGGELNATTAHDKALFYETLPSNQLALALWLESDRMKSLDITSAAVERTRSELIESHRGRLASDPFFASFAEFDRLLFPDELYGRPLIGTGLDMVKLTEADIAAFHRAYLRPQQRGPRDRRQHRRRPDEGARRPVLRFRLPRYGRAHPGPADLRASERRRRAHPRDGRGWRRVPHGLPLLSHSAGGDISAPDPAVPARRGRDIAAEEPSSQEGHDRALPRRLRGRAAERRRAEALLPQHQRGHGRARPKDHSLGDRQAEDEHRLARRDQPGQAPFQSRLSGEAIDQPGQGPLPRRREPSPGTFSGTRAPSWTGTSASGLSRSSRSSASISSPRTGSSWSSGADETAGTLRPRESRRAGRGRVGRPSAGTRPGRAGRRPGAVPPDPSPAGRPAFGAQSPRRRKGRPAQRADGRHRRQARNRPGHAPARYPGR